MAKHNELGEKGELLAEDYLKKIAKKSFLK